MLPGFPTPIAMLGVSGPEFIGATDGFHSSGTAVEVPVPVGTADGDLMVAFVFTAAGARTPVAPAGWSTVTSDGTAKPGVGIFTKVATGSEPATYGFSISGASTNIRGSILTFRGATAAGDGGTVVRSSSSTTVSASSITLAGGGAIISAFYSDQTVPNAGISSPPSGMTQATDASSSTSSPTFYVFYQTPTAAGSSGTKSLTFSATGNLAAVSVEIVP